MPGRSEFAAAADIGEHVDAAALEPRLADAGVVMREHRDLEATVTVEHCRGMAGIDRLALANDEVRHLRVIGRRGLELLHLHPAGVKERRQGLDWLGRIDADFCQVKRAR